MCTEDSPSGLWRTLGKRVGCKPSGVRIPHPPPPDPGTASGSGVFVACGAAGVLGAVGPGRLDGPGRCVCRWAAARPRAVRAASFARRVVSKPGQAPPPPTGTAARPSGPSGALHTCGAWSLFGSSTRRLKARPGPASTHGHRSQAPPPPTSTAAWHLLGPRRSPPALRPSPSLPSFLNPHPISHVIPPQPFQTLNSERWNCNVFRVH